MPASDVRLLPGSLRSLVEQARRRARASGALQPIETECEILEDDGVRFPVRVVSSLRRKARAGRTPSPPADPFAPPEPDLLVTEVSDTHVCVLNKYNVIDDHLLVVTRAFEHQERLLTRADFEALCACLAEYPSLGFYNGGAVAGASQAHKHLQLVPLPLGPQGPAIPMEPKLALVQTHDGLGAPAGPPFPHAWARMDSALLQYPDGFAAEALERYRALLARIGIREIAAHDGPRQSAPYNLLLTRDWMLAVPRTRECVEGVCINALGFAGSFFVPDRQVLARLRRLGPMQALRAVTGEPG